MPQSETEQAECQCPKWLKAQSAKAPGTETTGTWRQSLNYITVSVKIIKQNAVTQIMLTLEQDHYTMHMINVNIFLVGTGKSVVS